MKPVMLNIENIKKRYHDQWVLIVNPVYDKFDRIKKGNVIFHSEDRDKIDKVMLETNNRNIAIRYLGTVGKDISVIL